MNKPNNVVTVPCSFPDNFFKYWFVFLKPYHKLNNRDIDIATGFLKKRYELSKKISDPNLLDKVLMSADSRKAIREECNMSLPYFQVTMSKLRKYKIIVNDKINPRFIPNIVEEDNHFKLLILFNFKNDTNNNT